MSTTVQPPTTRASRRWRLGAVAAAGVAALAATVAAWPIASPAQAAVSAGTYTVHNSGSGLCLDAPGASGGVQLQQAACGDVGGQKWTLTAVGGGFRIAAASGGLCVGVRDASTSAGKVIELQSCTGAAGQTWSLTESGSSYRLVDTNGGKCMNLKDNSTSAGALVQTNSCDSAATKQWTFTPAGGGSNPTTTTTTTTSPQPGGGDGSGSWPSDTGSVHQTVTKDVGTFFDGGMKRYYGIGDGGQGESQDPVFELANGATIKNVIIGAPAGDGIHCLGTCTIQNVWWEDVGEDAATFLGTGGGTSYVIGGGARSASDKVFQHNGNGTVNISGFFVENAGKLYRACGNCTNSYQRNVVVYNIRVKSLKIVAGINTNWGDTARFTRVTVIGDSSHSTIICDKYKGVPKGSEPSHIGSGPDSTNCFYNPNTDVIWS